jgi:hypothetical protein
MVPGDYLLIPARDMPGTGMNAVLKIRAYRDKENCSKSPQNRIKKIGKLCGVREYLSRMISLEF